MRIDFGICKKGNCERLLVTPRNVHGEIFTFCREEDGTLFLRNGVPSRILPDDCPFKTEQVINRVGK